MSSKSKKEYLEKIRVRYFKSSKQEKGKILDEFCKVCGYNRSYAIRLLNKPAHIQTNSHLGRPKIYDDALLIKIIVTIWKAANLPCSKRLKEILPEWINYYEEYFKTELQDEIKRLVKTISASTLDTILSKYRRFNNKVGLSTTKPGSIIRTHIPVKTKQWDEKKPGYLEVDTVAHCGTEIGGDYVYSVNAVDIATGWTETRAIWGKGQKATSEAIEDIEISIPFELLGFDSDNGTEFMNWHLVRYFQDRKKPVTFTRARQYHKNDNAHIEEKNWSIVRQYLGYERFDNRKIEKKLNNLYKNELNHLINYFMPSFKLLEKKRVGSKIIKIHAKPKTPYQRILECNDIPKETKEKLTAIKKTLNPFKLQNIVKEKIMDIQSYATKTT